MFEQLQSAGRPSLFSKSIAHPGSLYYIQEVHTQFEPVLKKNTLWELVWCVRAFTLNASHMWNKWVAMDDWWGYLQLNLTTACIQQCPGLWLASHPTYKPNFTVCPNLNYIIPAHRADNTANLHTEPTVPPTHALVWHDRVNFCVPLSIKINSDQSTMDYTKHNSIINTTLWKSVLCYF